MPEDCTITKSRSWQAQTSERIINQNLLWGLAFIALFVGLSAFGFVSPIVAAFLHEFSAFFVIFNSARLLRFDDQTDATN